MALEIPAEHVPFVRKYFQLLNSLAENSPPGQNLRIDRELLSLSDEQLEGFKRLVSYLYNEDRHFNGNDRTRNTYTKKKANLIRQYYLLKNKPDLYAQKFGHEVSWVLKEKFDEFDELCKLLKKARLSKPSAEDDLASLLPVFDIMVNYFEEWKLREFEDADRISELLTILFGDERITPEEAPQYARVLVDYCNMDYHEREKFKNTREDIIFTKEILTEETGLDEDNLRTVTNYLLFGTASGGKRKGRKTRKQRKH